MIDIKFKRIGHHELPVPQPQTEGAAGMDLQSKGRVEAIEPGHKALINTGFAVEVPTGHVGLVIARSGNATKRGLVLANQVGVIDSDYRGEILVVLKNTSNTVQAIDFDERVAQMIVVPIARGIIMEVDELSETERAHGGFGSSGK